MLFKVLVMSAKKGEKDQEEEKASPDSKTAVAKKGEKKEVKVETASESKVEIVLEEISLANYGDFDFVWQGTFQPYFFVELCLKEEALPLPCSL